MTQDMNFSRNITVSWEDKIHESLTLTNHLNAAIVLANEERARERYKDRPKSLGAGRVGHPKAKAPYNRGCERALWYEMNQYESERPFPDKLYRIFDMGHHAEEIVAENLRQAGFDLMVEGQNGMQFGFALAHDPEDGHPRFKGFCDGVIVGGPDKIGSEHDPMFLKYPMLWENKAVNGSSFNKFRDDGVEKSHPQYYAQMQVYMNFLNLYENPGLITFLNRETGEIAVEFVRFNQQHCQAILDRAARVIGAKEPLMLERAAKDYEKLPCKWCNYRKQCEKDENDRVIKSPDAQQAAPNWLMKNNS